MKNLICEVEDPDPFSKALIVDFINKTRGVALKTDQSSSTDIFFIDAELSKRDLKTNGFTHLVIISANKNFVHSLFQNRIADYLYKPELSYKRFLQTVRKVKELAG